MRRVIVALTLCALALSGCQKMEEAAAEARGPSGRPGAKGRFVGVGIYAPGRLWTELVGSAPATPADPAAATLKDDDHVIVVVDTATGELRQCGNLSGHCLTSNPWVRPSGTQTAPAALLKHIDAARAEDEAKLEAELRARQK